MMETNGFYDIFNQYFNGLQLRRYQQTGPMEQMLVPKPIGDGCIQWLNSNLGIEIILSDYCLHKEHSIRFASDAAMVELAFHLRGSGDITISGNRYELTPGNCYLYFMQKFDVSFEYERNNILHSLAIAIPTPLFNQFMVRNEQAMDFSSIIGRGSFRKFQKTIDPKTADILHQILECSYSEPIRNLYLEGKALELLSVYFQRFLFENEGKSYSQQLSKSDLNKVRLAGEILVKKMESPPSLLELSRLVGINDYKLKIGFKKLFGTTAFGYLRHKRLERAMQLLQSGETSVSQTACTVGYTNPSYFAEAFRKKFGFNPSQVLRSH